MAVEEVYLNGKYLPATDASVSIFDRGFIFGDGVYEVIPVYGGRLFRLQQHLDRLRYSLGEIRLPAPLSDEAITLMFEHLLNDRIDDASIYLQITRGSAPRNHAFPDNITPTVLAYVQDLDYPNQAYREAGIHAVSFPDQRWQRCDIKSVSLLANVLARQFAHEHDAAEAVLFRDCKLTEGAASTLFVVLNGQLLTPSSGHSILPGITRDLVLELACNHGLQCQQTDISEKQVKQADELWLSSSTKEILPIVKLDGNPVGEGKPGPHYHQIIKLYDEFKLRFRNGEVS
ncbi:MAG TPA: D-amino acid aminotransferase [Gammaproteobacteria bacterium]|nr:D-alanine aminotransferase [bacterium BMS3Abin11]GMT41297.1 MAG: cytochrome c550 [bacterium]HDH09012.1 D-amino acid aminotransferase [Gammaproteobacteria bacterium]HDH15754.1 D-amino acid aminotransferase [Gammaproteobacteria bacterium]